MAGSNDDRRRSPRQRPVRAPPRVPPRRPAQRQPPAARPDLPAWTAWWRRLLVGLPAPRPQRLAGDASLAAASTARTCWSSVVLVAVTLLVRGVRLEQPAHMYFDEVYHARTATEFLQHWEYGEAHDIYEFTHPHLAKYAMAWGIRLAGGNEITGTVELGVPVSDAVLEPRWSPESRRRPAQRRPPLRRHRRGVRVYDLADGRAARGAAAGRRRPGPGRRGPDARTWPTPAGGLYRLDTTGLDALRHGEARSVPCRGALLRRSRRARRPPPGHRHLGRGHHAWRCRHLRHRDRRSRSRSGSPWRSPTWSSCPGPSACSSRRVPWTTEPPPPTPSSPRSPATPSPMSMPSSANACMELLATDGYVVVAAYLERIRGGRVAGGHRQR